MAFCSQRQNNYYTRTGWDTVHIKRAGGLSGANEECASTANPCPGNTNWVGYTKPEFKTSRRLKNPSSNPTYLEKIERVGFRPTGISAPPVPEGAPWKPTVRKYDKQIVRTGGFKPSGIEPRGVPSFDKFDMIDMSNYQGSLSEGLKKFMEGSLEAMVDDPLDTEWLDEKMRLITHLKGVHPTWTSSQVANYLARNPPLGRAQKKVRQNVGWADVGKSVSDRLDMIETAIQKNVQSTISGQAQLMEYINRTIASGAMTPPEVAKVQEQIIEIGTPMTWKDEPFGHPIITTFEARTHIGFVVSILTLSAKDRGLDPSVGQIYVDMRKGSKRFGQVGTAHQLISLITTQSTGLGKTGPYNLEEPATEEQIVKWGDLATLSGGQIIRSNPLTWLYIDLRTGRLIDGAYLLENPISPTELAKPGRALVNIWDARVVIDPKIGLPSSSSSSSSSSSVKPPPASPAIPQVATQPAIPPASIEEPISSATVAPVVPTQNEKEEVRRAIAFQEQKLNMLVENIKEFNRTARGIKNKLRADRENAYLQAQKNSIDVYVKQARADRDSTKKEISKLKKKLKSLKKKKPRGRRQRGDDMPSWWDFRDVIQ